MSARRSYLKQTAAAGAALSPLGSLLPVATQDGKPLKKSRVFSVQQAHDIYSTLRRGDMASALNRARIQIVMDGYPPFDPAKLKLSGQDGIANINFGLMKSYLNEACQPILDQLSGVEKFLNVAINRKPNESSEDIAEWAAIIGTEQYRTVKTEPTFPYRKNELVRQMVAHGVSVPYFADTYDWRWKSEPLGEFLIPHFTPATEEAVEVACMVRSRQPHELARYRTSKVSGWDVSEIERALADAKPRTLKPADWERMQAMAKDNDIWLTSQANEITTVDMWVRELDGRVSHYIFREDGNGQEFLFKKVGRFDNQSQAFIFFPFDVSTNGYYHGIRGLGYEALDLVQEINRTFSGFMDAMRLQSKLALKNTSGTPMENLDFIEHSAFLLIPTGADVVDKQIPNFGDAMIPALQFLEIMLNRKMRRFSTDAGMPNMNRANREAVMAKIQELAKMSSGNADMFWQSMERLEVEQFRRMIRPNYKEEEPGGKEVKEFKARCEELGVPKDIWERIDLKGTTAERAVGAGSASQQMVQNERLMELADRGYFDDEGMRAFKRDMVRGWSNNDKADRYVGPMYRKRPTQDARNAADENDLMSLGRPRRIWENDDDLVHARIHISGNEEDPTGSLLADTNQLEEALKTGNEDAVVQLAEVMTMKHEHASAHVERLKMAPIANQYREQLEQVGGLIWNAQKKRQRILQKRHQEQSEAGGQNGNGQDINAVHKESMNLERTVIETQMKLRAREEEHRQAMVHREEDHRQQMAQADEDAAQKLAIKHAEQLTASRSPSV